VSIIENAEIRSTFLGIEDHGLFTCNLALRGESWGQGFGGYTLDEWSPEERRRKGTAYGLEFIKGILGCLEIEEWEKLPGTALRIERKDGRIIKIGHYLKDKWFDPEDIKAMR
jgi:hypothetical protein